MTKTLLSPILRPILWLMCKLLFRVEVKSANPDFGASRLIIVANHESLLDGLLLGLFLPVDPIFVVNTQIARVSGFRFILSMVDHITVDPANPMAMRQIMHLIESGRPVVIFPEGRITVTGSLMKVYEGSAFAACKTGASIIPVRLDGPARSHFSRTSGLAPRGWFPKMRITILPATSVPMPDLPTAKLRRRQMGESLRRIMQEMLFATRTPTTLFDALLDACCIYGRKRHMVEDIRQIEYTYDDMLKMTLMLGRLSSHLDASGARIGLLLPNPRTDAWPDHRPVRIPARTGTAEFHRRHRRDAKRVHRCRHPHDHYVTRFSRTGETRRQGHRPEECAPRLSGRFARTTHSVR